MMKWMMTIAAAAAIAGGTVAAQAGQSMAAHDKMDQMGGMAKMDLSYTGCVESSGSTFSLTRAVATDPSMKHDAMKHDGMAHEGMAHDAMKSDGMKNDATMAKTFSLSSPSVDLRKHVGQKVTVTGSSAASNGGMTASDASALVVKSVKVLAKSCS